MSDSGILINGRYEILEELGEGASGIVYAARDRTLKKRVALKLLRYQGAWDGRAQADFELEVTVPGRVESEHIVQVFEATRNMATQRPFFVMELLKGSNLQKKVEQEGKVNPGLVVQYFKQVASGLDKAHNYVDDDGRAAPIVHRDIKPSNLYLTQREDGSPLVKILDWGIAKLLSSSGTQTGHPKGTPLYYSPEQVKLAALTPATDIWQLGLVGFFLLTGECYWRCAKHADATMLAVAKEICEGPVILAGRRIRELGVDLRLPQAFDDWFIRCVNVDPQRRFASAGQAASALAAALEPMFVKANPEPGVGVAQTSRYPSIRGLVRSLTPSAASHKTVRRAQLWLALAVFAMALLSAATWLPLRRSESTAERGASTLQAGSPRVASSVVSSPPMRVSDLSLAPGTQTSGSEPATQTSPGSQTSPDSSATASSRALPRRTAELPGSAVSANRNRAGALTSASATSVLPEDDAEASRRRQQPSKDDFRPRKR